MNNSDTGFVRLERPNGRMGWFKTRRASEHVKALRLVDTRIKPLVSECSLYYEDTPADATVVTGEGKRPNDPCFFADSKLN